MLLFLGDLHLGRGSNEESRAAEREAVDLLEAYREELLHPEGGLVLLGDVFNAYLEYDALVPAGFIRFQGALARLGDSGVRIRYLVGNRDPWHLDHFARELGAEVITDHITLRAFGKRLYIAHGDAFARSETSYQVLRPFLRSPMAYWMYRHLLPGDSGFRLAKWVASKGRGEPEAPVVNDLRKAAERLLLSHDVDAVVLGHCHHAEIRHLQSGIYLNAGYWFGERTYGVLDAGGLDLRQWAQRSPKSFAM